MGVTSVMAGKAVLLNTTDAITDNGTSGTSDDQYVQGSLWNRRYGWGYLNLGAAYQHGLDMFIDSVPDGPDDADFRLYVGQMFTYERATLVWQRHVAYNGATYRRRSRASAIWTFLRGASRAGRCWSPRRRGSTTWTVPRRFGRSGRAEGRSLWHIRPNVPTEEFALATQENFVRATGPAFAATFTHRPARRSASSSTSP